LMASPEAELAALVADGGPFEIRGSGTKRGLGRHTQTNSVLDMSGFSGIALYEPDELVLEAGAATPLAVIEKTLAENNQQLAFEPPDYSKLLGGNSSGTLGGLVSCGLSGPRRLKAGAARDHILGFSGVSGRGEVFKAGGRVVKNVTGFDIAKLMVGAYGTLVALTSMTDARAIQAMSVAMQSSCEVSGAAHLPNDKTLLRLEGVRPSITYRREKLNSLLKDFGRMGVLAEKESRDVWTGIRDVHPLADDKERIIWRLSVPPSEGAEVVAKITRQLDAQYFFDWAGGLIWLSVPATPDASASIIRGSFDAGHATLIRASEEVRSHVDVFQPQTAALQALNARVKTSFDPNAVFNPARMYKDT
jgi:glycolate oxidase FAD binding subunit